MKTERRKHDRLLPLDDTFAALGRDYAKVGKIKNISHGGLAVEYITGEQNSMISSQVDIFLPGKVFNLYNVPCCLIYDIDVHIPHVDSQYLKLLTTKQCGVKFEKLSVDDLSQLHIFIESHTAKSAK